jgi:hypothetical protein
MTFSFVWVFVRTFEEIAAFVPHEATERDARKINVWGACGRRKYD